MRSRVSIARIMALTVLAAIDTRAIRSSLLQEGGPADALIWSGGTPMLNVLAVGFVALQMKSQGRVAAPFLTGFEIGGGLAWLFYAAISTMFPAQVLNHFKRVFAPLIDYLVTTRVGTSGYFVTVLELALMAYFTTLLLVTAVIGGWWARRRAQARSAPGRP